MPAGNRSLPLIYATVTDTSGNKQRITEASHRIRSLVYTDSEKKADKAVLTIENFDLSNFDDPVWSRRNTVQLSWGYPGNMAPARTCVITKVTGFTVLQVEARGRAVLLDTVKRSRTFRGMTRSAVVTQIAGEYNFSGLTLNVEDTKTVYPAITQARLTDAQLLRKLAIQQGFEFYIDQDGFHWHERRLNRRPIRSFTWYTEKGRGDVIDIRIEKDITRRPATVTRVARDALNKKTLSEAASDSADAQREGTGEVLLISEPDLQSGSLIYVPDDTNMSIDSEPSGAGARTEAERKFRSTQRTAVRLELDAVGDPQMLGKTLFTLNGVGRVLTGNYHAREVAHTVNAGSYKMAIKGISDGGGPESTPAGRALEDGIPEVTPQTSKAKRTPPTAQADSSASPTNTDNPAALYPVDLKDKDGNVVGTSWSEREPPTVSLGADGVLTSE